MQIVRLFICNISCRNVGSFSFRAPINSREKALATYSAQKEHLGKQNEFSFPVRGFGYLIQGDQLEFVHDVAKNSSGPEIVFHFLVVSRVIEEEVQTQSIANWDICTESVGFLLVMPTQSQNLITQCQETVRY